MKKPSSSRGRTDSSRKNSRSKPTSNRYNSRKNDDSLVDGEYKKPFKRQSEDKPERKRYSDNNHSDDVKKSYGERSERPRKTFDTTDTKKTFGDRPRKSFNKSDEKPYKKRYSDNDSTERENKPYSERLERPRKSFTRSDDKPYKKRFPDNDSNDGVKKSSSERDVRKRKTFNSSDEKPYKKRYSETTDSEKPFSDRPKKSFNSQEDKPYKKRYSGTSDSEKSFNDRPKKTYKTSSDDKPYKKRIINSDDDIQTFIDKPKKRINATDERPYKKKFSDSTEYKKPYNDESDDNSRPKRLVKRKSTDYNSEKKEIKKSYPNEPYSKPRVRKSFADTNYESKFDSKKSAEGVDEYTYKKSRTSNFSTKKKVNSDEDEVRLNKYIANAGICSRREADQLIETGAIMVNGKIVTELGTKISKTDVVKYGDQVLKGEKNVYLLLNKPKDFITTSDDPDGRKTVMMLIEGACKERVYPIGRLDRATTGLLLFTNDGDMAKKLMHPKHKVPKIYHVELDRALTHADFQKIIEGIELEDGIALVDELAYTGAGNDKKNIGIEIHQGKNRIVRRIFESLEYSIKKLDRVYYAGLTKKDLPRGRYRMLTDMEVNMLKMI